MVSAGPRFFGPDSVSWRVHHDRDRGGGIRALALQSLHPEVMLGFDRVTDHREGPVGPARAPASTSTRSPTAPSPRPRRRRPGTPGARRARLDRPEWLLWVTAAPSTHGSSGPPPLGCADDRRRGRPYVEEQVVAAQLVGCVRPTYRGPSTSSRAYLECDPRLTATPGPRRCALVAVAAMQPRVGGARRRDRRGRPSRSPASACSPLGAADARDAGAADHRPVGERLPPGRSVRRSWRSPSRGVPTRT